MITFALPKLSKFFPGVGGIDYSPDLPPPASPIRGRPTLHIDVLIPGRHEDNGYSAALNRHTASSLKEKVVILSGYTDIAPEVEKLGLPSLEIPNRFLDERLSLPLLQHTVGPSGTSNPSTSTTAQ